MELQDLRIFERVAREGSISRAAAALTMGQPGVSQRLRLLEAELGRQLFLRHRRGVELTSDGLAFLPYVQRLLGLLNEGVETLRAAAGVTRIALAAPPSLAGYFLPPLVHQIVDSGHDVVLDSAHSHEVMQRLLDGAIHAGFLLAMPARSGIRQEVLCRDPIVAVAAPTHPLAGRGAMSLADLARHRIAHYAWGRPGYVEFRERLEVLTAGPTRGLIKVSSVEAARQLVLTGEYVTLVPRMTVATELAGGQLEALLVTDLPPYTWEITLAYRERKEQEPAVSALLAVVRAWEQATAPR